MEYMPGWQCDISGARQLGGSARGRAQLRRICGKGHRLSHRLCLRRRGKRKPHSPIRKMERQRRSIFFRVDKLRIFRYNKVNQKRGTSHEQRCLRITPIVALRVAVYAAPVLRRICAFRHGGGCGPRLPARSTSWGCPSPPGRSRSWKRTSPTLTTPWPSSASARCATM